MSSLYPSDPADLFAMLVLELDVNFDGHDAYSWMQEERVRDVADLLEHTALDADEIASESIAELLDYAENYSERVFAILLGLDRALLYANPFFGSFDQGALTRVAIRYASTGRLNTDTTHGILLPRCSFPGRPQHTPNSMNDAFVSVVWVPRSEWGRTQHSRIRPRNDFTRLERGGRLTIACVPFADDIGDFDHEIVQHEGARFFRLSGRDSGDPERIRRLIDELDLLGAMIVVLPELALTPALLDQWLTAIDDRPPPSESRLKWILAGTGNVGSDDRPVNRAVLLDRVTGETILTQDKVFPFTLTPDQLREWRLTPMLGEDAIEEDIVSGKRIAVAESALGRIVVLVCEDLARLVDLGPPLRSHGLSHVLAPVFSKEVKLHHWEHVKAKEYASEVGSLVVVSNSLVIARLMGETGAIGTSLAHAPYTTQLRTSHDRDEIAVFNLDAGHPVPSTGVDQSYDPSDDDY